LRSDHRTGAVKRASLVALALLAACGGRVAGNRPAPARDNNVVLADELSASGGGSDLLSALRGLRPNWFRPVTAGRRGPLVYLDRVLLGGTNTLRQIPVRIVLTVRYFSGPEAQGAFGAEPLDGAIAVTTAPPPP
jgi:hypothetical protein